MTRTTDDKKEDAKQKVERLAKDLMLQQGNPGKLVWEELSLIVSKVKKETGITINKPRMYELLREASKEYEENETREKQKLRDDKNSDSKKAHNDSETFYEKLKVSDTENLRISTERDTLKDEIDKLHNDVQKINGDALKKVSEATAKAVNDKRDADQKRKESEERCNEMKDKYENDLQVRQGLLEREHDSNLPLMRRNAILEGMAENSRTLFLYAIVTLAGLVSYVAMYLALGIPGITVLDLPALIWAPFFFLAFLSVRTFIHTYLNHSPWIGISGAAFLGLGVSVGVLLPYALPGLTLNHASETVLFWIIPAFVSFTYLYSRNLLHGIAIRNQVQFQGAL